ncbi:hypothetical protein BHE74_00010629 [Ensete ventricosum]|uniref:Uncharacterized protein n=1 Tax=Ensete ventricosum TaxID=4639 RepID=A0A444CFJ9_ENSVE|nr:hypothetical protein GW17_00053593 [Ensete ventricosum]RWW81006.1 hypothetical protein BHE74_00010629 [Ensete ventricosum]RZR72642.1 hypothetical protein BHM03_00015442 [Ensete ventricosum]
MKSIRNRSPIRKVNLSLESYSGDYLFRAPTGRTTESGTLEDQINHMTNSIEALGPIYNQSTTLAKEVIKRRTRDRSTKGLCWHCDKMWSYDHHCKKGRLLMIEPIEESKHEDEDLEHEENVKEDP